LIIPRQARRCLIIEGGATLRGIGMVYRSVLPPAIGRRYSNHYVMGAANYRSLRGDEEIMARVVFQTHWL